MTTKVTSYEAINSIDTSGTANREPIVNSTKRLARIAGGLYLLVGVFGGFAQGFVYPRIYAAGDATTTAGNVLANSDLVRAGVVADLFQATVYVFLALVLYRLLKHVNGSVAGAMVVLVVIAATITCLNAVFEFEAMQIATGAVNLAAVQGAGSNGLVLLLVDAHHYGLLTAQIFFGLWLTPLGYLAYKSGLFPRALGIVLIAGTVSYLVDMLAAFLVPSFGRDVHALVSIMPAIAEIWMVGYLLMIGVKTLKPAEHIRVAIAMPGAEA